MFYKRVFALVVLAAITVFGLAALFTVLDPVQANVLHDTDPLNSSGQSSANTFIATLSGAEEVPPVATDATGVARFTLVNSTTLNYEIAVRDIVHYPLFQLFVRHAEELFALFRVADYWFTENTHCDTPLVSVFPTRTNRLRMAGHTV